MYNATAFPKALADATTAGNTPPTTSGSVDGKNPPPEKMVLNYTTILVAPPSCLKSPYQCPKSSYIPYLKGELSL